MGMGHAGSSVVPAQLPAFPSNEEIQRGTVPLQDSVLDLLYGDRFIAALHQPVSCQPGSVELACLVEPPVLGDAQRGILGRFVQDIGSPGSS